MSILRDEEQVTLQEVVLACQQSIDHLRDAANAVDNESMSGTLLELAERRERHVLRLAEAIRGSGDLPAVPDTDREAIEQLLHHAAAATATESPAACFAQQRIDGDTELLQLIQERRQRDISAGAGELLAALVSEVEEALLRLRQLQAELSGAS